MSKKMKKSVVLLGVVQWILALLHSVRRNQLLRSMFHLVKSYAWSHQAPEDRIYLDHVRYLLTEKR